MLLGEKIHWLRKQKGLSQEELAAQITVSRQAVSKWELCESMPDVENIVQLSRLFCVSIDYLLNDELEAEAAPATARGGSEKTLGKAMIASLVIFILSIAALAFLALRTVTPGSSSSLLIVGILMTLTGTTSLVLALVKIRRKSKRN